MIRPIDIRLNAAHPELPLAEAVTFTGSPSTVLIRGVPPNCGRWAITAVFVAASFPDGSTTTRAAVQSANGVWVATLPATATSGRTTNGIRVMADGIDENGEAVTGYILGVADFAVASLGVAPAPEPGETSWQMLYFDAVPSVLRKGDVTKVDDVLKFYNGTAWEVFDARAYELAGVAFNRAAQAITAANQINIALANDYYTSAQTDEAIDKLAAYYITADAAGNPFATHAALANAQTYYSGGAVRTPTRNDYAVVSADETHGGAEWRYIYAVDAQGFGQWEAQYAVEGVIAYDNTVTRTSANGVKSSGIWSMIWGALTALPTGFSSLYDWVVNQLAGKADASNLPYAISESIPLTVSGGAAATTLADRTHNVRTVAAPGSGNTTTITATLPPIVAGKSRDMFLNLTVGTQASDAGDISLSIVEPSGATVQIDIGSAEDIGIGKNEILITENALPSTSGNGTTTHWLVTVRHEDFT